MTDLRPILFDEIYQLLICGPCGYAINPGKDSVKEHLTRHHQILELNAWNNIAEEFSNFPSINVNDILAIDDLKSRGYVSSLPFKLDRWACSHADCSYVCPLEETLKSHCRRLHRDHFLAPIQGVAIQRIFGSQTKKGGQYFQIDPPAAPVHDDTDPVGTLLEATATYAHQLN